MKVSSPNGSLWSSVTNPSFLLFSFIFLLVCLFLCYAFGLLVPPRGVCRYCTPQDRSKETELTSTINSEHSEVKEACFIQGLFRFPRNSRSFVNFKKLLTSQNSMMKNVYMYLWGLSLWLSLINLEQVAYPLRKCVSSFTKWMQAHGCSRLL